MRKTNRASKKLEKLVQKHPELSKDTIIRDTVEVISIEYVYKTKIETEIDTLYTDTGTIITIRPPKHFEYEREGIKVSLDWINGEYNLTIEAIADTIYVPFEKEIRVLQPKEYIPIPIKGFKRVIMNLGWSFLILIILLLILVALKIFTKVSIPFMVALMLLSAGCSKYNYDKVEQTYTIKEGKYRSVNRISRVHNDDLWFHFTFEENHRYLSEIPDDENRLDINKLYGLTSKKIHSNSCRIGWRELNNGNFEVLAYWYIDNVRGYKHLYEAKQGELLEMVVTNFGDYRFYCNGEQIIIKTESGGFDKSYRAWPYFGGNNPAPHTMNFKITEQ